jgi:hypothetical protein
LLNDWDSLELESWGLDLPKQFDEEILNEKEPELNNNWFLNIEFENERECEGWYNKLIEQGLICKIVQ